MSSAIHIFPKTVFRRFKNNNKRCTYLLLRIKSDKLSIREAKLIADVDFIFNRVLIVSADKNAHRKSKLNLNKKYQPNIKSYKLE